MSTLADRIPELLTRVDLPALVSGLAGVEAKRSGGTITYHCPNPSHEDRNPSFTVKDGRWKCWSVCGTGGDAIDLLVWLRGYRKADAIVELASLVGLDRQGPSVEPSERSRLVSWSNQLGWGPHVIDALDLTVVADNYGRPRVRFPFRLGGEVPYHQDRAMGDAVKLRWLSPKGRRPIPYEADRMRLAADRGHVFVLEGVTDVAALVDVYTAPAVVGVPGVQAWRSGWAAAFRGLAVYVVADNDEAGVTFRSRLSEDLAPVARAVRHVFVPEAHNDVAAWRRCLDPERFDIEMMAAVEAVVGHHVEMAG